VFRDLPITARELKATPAMLERIYDGAKLGLRGDSLALAAGMLPVELARLKLMDPIAEIAEMKGRADSEMTMSRTLYEAAERRGFEGGAGVPEAQARLGSEAAGAGGRSAVDLNYCGAGDGRKARACCGSDRGCGGNP
jgi:predicted transcriptional regulator